jgi:hypothetical protein
MAVLTNRLVELAFGSAISHHVCENDNIDPDFTHSGFRA